MKNEVFTFHTKGTEKSITTPLESLLHDDTREEISAVSVPIQDQKYKAEEDERRRRRTVNAKEKEPLQAQ